MPEQTFTFTALEIYTEVQFNSKYCFCVENLNYQLYDIALIYITSSDTSQRFVSHEYIHWYIYQNQYLFELKIFQFVKYLVSLKNSAQNRDMILASLLPS